MRTINELKEIWTKASFEILSEQFTLLTDTASEVLKRPGLDKTKLKACMANVQALMESKLAKYNVTAEEKQVMKENSKEWAFSIIPAIQQKISEQTSPVLKEQLIKGGKKSN